MTTVADVMQELEQIAPLALAEDWDNVGLLLGDPAATIGSVVCCLTVTPEVVDETVETAAEMIVSHHPILFRPVQRLTTATAEGRMILRLMRAGVAVYSPHSAFDNTEDGINALLARRLGLTDVVSLRPAEASRSCKIVVFVPDSDLSRVSDALFTAGAGKIGQYRECSFRLAGTGTFFATDATNPTVGQKGRREDVQEWRLEAVCPEAEVDRVIAAMRKSHSYEEPAYDVYPLRSTASRIGGGRMGTLSGPTTAGELAEFIKGLLKAATVQIVGGPSRPVQRVAIACGAAGEFIGDAVQAQADVLLTGEVRFHECLAAEGQGLGLILPGHYATERCGVEDLAARLERRFPELTVWASKSERDPLTSS
jgi:dinuclear metal center YbgI/SA1388 family protein